MATITEDYVSFETAKLLKEKGFPQDPNICNTAYTPKGKFSNNAKSFAFYYEWVKPRRYSIAPTQAMAMKWLREIHKLDIDVSIEYKNSKKVYYYSILKKTVIRNIDCLHSETNFDSYEQAAEAAIKYYLENLIK